MKRPTPPHRTLLSVRQFSAKHPAFTEPSLRNLIFNAGPRRDTRGRTLSPGNGLEVALVRIGRRIYIDEQRFFAWADRNGGARAPARPRLSLVRRPITRR